MVNQNYFEWEFASISRFPIVFFLICCFFSLHAQNVNETMPKILNGTLTKALRGEIENDKNMIEALDLLKEDGDFINIGEGKVQRIANDTVSVEVTFTISTKVKDRKTAFKKLVYSKSKSKKATVFFDEKVETSANNPTVSSERIFGCGSWSSWTVYSTSCDPVFGCWLKGQQAYFNLEEKTRQCRNGIQRRTRKCKVHCGC
ncbi:MAG: hypothetical protein WCR52_06035 [Bacteroidota bacterium]